MKLADPLQPPYASLSRQQQFGSQRRTPLSGVDVSRLAPESGRRANQITNALLSYPISSLPFFPAGELLFKPRRNVVHELAISSRAIGLSCHSCNAIYRPTI
jgi:hypothetical protein